MGWSRPKARKIHGHSAIARLCLNESTNKKSASFGKYKASSERDLNSIANDSDLIIIS